MMAVAGARSQHWEAVMSRAGSIDHWHILISGFRQDLSNATGFDKLLLRMLDANVSGFISDHQWSDDWGGVAEAIKRRSTDLPTIKVYAYSWGAGWGFVQLAKHLRRRGFRVAHAVLADPVYRSRLLPTWLPLNPLSMLSTPTINVPGNVNEVSWFYQRIDRPAGHRPVAKQPSTRINEGVELVRAHAFMDDAPEFHSKALEVASC